MQKAEKEYELFRQKELASMKSDFDLFLEGIKTLLKKDWTYNPSCFWLWLQAFNLLILIL